MPVEAFEVGFSAVAGLLLGLARDQQASVPG
jgi:hypothetical protein